MNPERWRRIEAVCEGALERRPLEREAFLQEACAGDEDLRREVDSLLAEQVSAGRLFDGTAWDAAASIAAGEPDPADLPAGGRPSPGDLVPGDRLGHFRVVGRIGAGGMGVVYRAHDEQLDRDVALKVLPADAFDDEAARARLLREAKAAAALNHPHICSVYDVGQAELATAGVTRDAGAEERQGARSTGRQEIAYIAMELVEGESLGGRLTRGPMPPGDVTAYGLQLADALTHAHARGIIHRDLKSANVIVTADGRAKILDFGLAKQSSSAAFADTRHRLSSLTGAGLITGTLAYMAPERLRGAAADARTDIWALGVVLHEMVGGQRPFHAETGLALGSAILTQSPTPLPTTIPVELRAVIERCLEKDPERRYQHAEEVREALAAVRSGTTSPWTVWRYRAARSPWAAAGIAALVLLLVAVFLSRGWLAAQLGWSPRVRSVAVLPLENLSHAPDTAYLADGLHEALITELSQTDGLTVIQRPSMKRFEGTRETPAEIARDLGVEWLVTGTVLQSGNRLQVTAHLMHGGREPATWNEKYDRDTSDVLRLQGDLVAAIATELRTRLAPERRARLARTIDPSTYARITKARFLANTATPGGFDKAVKYLTQVVTDDPREPLAHASLAVVYSLMAHEGVPGAQAKAGVYARQAIELDPLSAEAHQALANTKAMHEWNLEGAAAEYRETIRLNPNLPDAHAYYSWYLMTRRRTDEQLAEMKKAQSLDPLNPLYSAWLAQMYEMVGRHDDALVQVENTLDLAPGFPLALMTQVRAYSGKGMHRQAVDLATRAAAHDPSARVLLAQALVDAGRKDEAHRLAAEIDRTTPSDAFEAYYVAYVHGTLGESTQAIAWLHRVVESRHVWAPWIDTEFGLDRRLAGLRGDPRYQALIAKVRPLGR